MALIPRLFGITPGDDGHPRDVQSLAEAAASGGMDALILREPARTERELVTLARVLSPCVGPGLILHASHASAASIAEASGWGLHLPSHADPSLIRTRIQGLMGISCHNSAQLHAAAAAGCDYAFISPIFTPHSKPDDSRTTIGIDGLALLTKQCPIPVIALGGITPNRARQCVAAGAHGVAAMGIVFGPTFTPEDVRTTAQELYAAVHQ